MSSTLSLRTVIGFAGDVPNGLRLHPNGETLLYPLGSTLVTRSISNPAEKDFLKGHSDKITAVAVSRSGRFVASGQRTHMGYKADIIIWDFERREILHRLNLHKVKVQSLSFSPDEEFLVSVGGEDDNQIVLWDVMTGKALAGATAANDTTRQILFLNHSSNQFVSVGNYTIRLWEVGSNLKLTPTDFCMGNMRRIVNCCVIDDTDQFLICGTHSGDVMLFQMASKMLKMSAPQKTKFEMGVTALSFDANGDIIVGAGDGKVSILHADSFKLDRSSTQLLGSVTSICLTQDGSMFMGTNQSTIYSVQPNSLESRVYSCCHFESINSVSFPRNYSEVFCTTSIGEIRIWNAHTGENLITIKVPNLECNCAEFSVDGKAIVSGWSDGKIRAFGPKSGKLLYTINDAHRITGQKKISGEKMGVTAIAVANDGLRILSGGSDRQCRVWRVGLDSQRMEASLNEHKGTINSIKVRSDDSEFISASDDGSCIVWDLSRYLRNNILSEHTYFKDVCYLNDESQIVTAGSDKKVVYWDSVDCSAIREIDAGEEELMTCDISASGNLLACGGLGSNVKVFDYDSVEVVGVGVGHSCGVSCARFSPDQDIIVSVGYEGGIFVWEL